MKRRERMTREEYLKTLKHFARLYKEMLATIEKLKDAEMPEPISISLQPYFMGPVVQIAPYGGWEGYGMENNPDLPKELEDFSPFKTEIIDGITFFLFDAEKVNWEELDEQQ